MQTPKTRIGSLEVPPRTSPSKQTSQKSSPANRTARQLKVAGSDSDTIASPNPSSRTPKKSPKVMERGSPRSPITEKKRPTKLSELEAQLAKLQDDLKKAKDQLTSSEALKRQAQHEAEETKKQLAVTSARLEESHQQLLELSASEDARVQELRKLSHDRDRAWQSELEAIQNQHSIDSAALASAKNDIQKLKRQLEITAESESSAYAEIQSLRDELSETLSLVESMKREIDECKGSEARVLEVARQAQAELEAALANAESLRSEGLKAMDAYNEIASELKQSKAEVSSLENLVTKLQEDLENKVDLKERGKGCAAVADDDGNNEESEKLRAEIDSLKAEIDKLKSLLEASELRYQEEYIQSTLQIRNAYDQIELAKSESGAREAELKAELDKARNTIEELKSELISKEAVLQDASENNKELNIRAEENGNRGNKSELEMELQKLKEDLQDLHAVLLDKETQFQNTTQENELLKTQMQKRENEKNERNEEADALADAAKASEREALVKLGYVTEEADKSSKRANRVAEQLDAAQKSNTELEAELRRLKVQSDQWRKAAEAAAAMLSTGKDGKFVDRTVSFDGSYNSTIGAKMGSPLSDDLDDESPKKKNGNMLKKIGVLWKKGQK